MHQLSAGKYFSILLFAVLLIAMILAEYFIIHSAAFVNSGSLMPFAVTFDLVIFIPLLFYFVLVRRNKWNMASVFLVFVLSVVLASWMIPSAQQQWLRYVQYAAGAAEAGLFLFALFKLRKIIRHYNELDVAKKDFLKNMEEAIGREMGNNFSSKIIASEISMIRYGLFFWKGEKEVNEGQLSFTMYKQSGFVALFCAILAVAVIEIFAGHLLIRLWNNTAALFHTILSSYTLIFLVSYLFSVLRRPIVLTEKNIQLRVGILWNIEASFTEIESIEEIKISEKGKTHIDLAEKLFTTPEILIRFKNETEARGLYGIKKKIKSVSLTADQKVEFIQAVRIGMKRT